ncbi:MAG: hypothetical protein U0610_19870 [bacterium]
MSTSRHWYTGPVLIVRNIVRTAQVLEAQGLPRFVPFAAILFLLAGGIWVVNTISPLAPFIYSLF